MIHWPNNNAWSVATVVLHVPTNFRPRSQQARSWHQCFGTKMELFSSSACQRVAALMQKTICFSWMNWSRNSMESFAEVSCLCKTLLPRTQHTQLCRKLWYGLWLGGPPPYSPSDYYLFPQGNELSLGCRSDCHHRGGGGSRPKLPGSSWKAYENWRTVVISVWMWEGRMLSSITIIHSSCISFSPKPGTFSTPCSVRQVFWVCHGWMDGYFPGQNTACDTCGSSVLTNIFHEKLHYFDNSVHGCINTSKRYRYSKYCDMLGTTKGQNGGIWVKHV